MNIKMLTILGATLLLAGCSTPIDTDLETQRLLEADRAFSEVSVASGAGPAFDQYMADSAVILRNNAHPFVGREEINSLFENWPGGTLEWEPIFARVSLAGDLGYTIGRWDYSVTDSTGNINTGSGYYITIWEKGPDGQWKYVFDTGTEGVPEADTTGTS